MADSIIGTESDVRDGAIGKVEKGSGRIDMALDLSRNALPLECVLLKMASVGEPRCVENATLGKMVSLRTAFEIPDTHHRAVLARKFVNPSRLG